MIFSDLPPNETLVIAGVITGCQAVIVTYLARVNSNAKQAKRATESTNGTTMAQQVEYLVRWVAKREALDDVRHEQNVRRMSFLARRQRAMSKRLDDIDRRLEQ